jgi:hypothetical protein
VEYGVRITGKEAPEIIRTLAKLAAEDCYVTNMLKEAYKVKGRALLDGEHLADLQVPAFESLRVTKGSNGLGYFPALGSNA